MDKKRYAALALASAIATAGFCTECRNDGRSLEDRASQTGLASIATSPLKGTISNIRNVDVSIPLNQEKQKELERKLHDYLRSHPISKLDEAVDFSLDYTAGSLRFRFFDYFVLRHKGSGYYKFGTGVKSTDCWDYSYLFSKTLQYVLKDRNIQGMRVESVRGDINLYGIRDNHDWVRVTDKDGKQFHIDPTFYDFGLPYMLNRYITPVTPQPSGSGHKDRHDGKRDEPKK